MAISHHFEDWDPRYRHQQIWSLANALLLVPRLPIFLLCLHMVKETSEFPTLENWSPSKASFPNTIILGTRFQHMHLDAGVSHSVVSWLFAAPWTVAHQAPLSMEFSRQEYWSKLPCPLPGDLPNPGTEHCRQILYHLSHQGSHQLIVFTKIYFTASTQPQAPG